MSLTSRSSNSTVPAGEKQTYFLTDLAGIKVMIKGKKIGRLADIIIVDKEGDRPIITHLLVSRSFGRPSLIIPWKKVYSMNRNSVNLRISNQEKYVGEIPEGAVPLKDYILDKKILDMKGREVELVYDVKLTMFDGNLYVSGVDFSSYGLLRRIHLGWFADAVYSLADKIRDQTISWKYVQTLPTDIGRFKGDVKLKILKEKLEKMHPVDLAEILGEIDPVQRNILFNDLEPSLASDTLEEIGPGMQRDLVESMKKEKIASLITQMTPAKAADVLSVIPWYEVGPILRLVKRNHARKIRSLIEKGDETVADFITSRFIEIHNDDVVGDVEEEYPHLAKGKEVLMYLYVADSEGRLVGMIDLKELLKAEETALIKDVMISNVISLKLSSTLRKASVIFSKYDFDAIPVVDKKGKMAGAVLYDDVMELSKKLS